MSDDIDYIPNWRRMKSHEYRAEPVIDKPIDIKPTHGGKIVTYREFLEMQEAGKAQRGPPVGAFAPGGYLGPRSKF